MLPWALDRRVSRCCRAFAPPRRCWTFRLAVPNPLQRPRPERRGKARSLGLVWLRAPDVAADPKVDCVRFAGPLTARRLLRFRSARSISRRKPIGIGRVWLRRIPEGRTPRPHPTWAPKDRMGCQWIRPERIAPHRCGATSRNPPRRSAHPKALGFPTKSRRISEETGSRSQRTLRRAASGGSSSFSPSFRGCPRT